MRVATQACLQHPSLDAMNFLNEVVMAYPSAISFAPGRPVERLFNVGESLGWIDAFVQRRAAETGVPAARFLGGLGQYGKTNGVILDLIARYLKRDEGIEAAASGLMITSGCQEAMAILMMGLFDPARDALLVSDPAYIGITGIARVLGVETFPAAAGDCGLEPDAVRVAAAEARRRGKRPRAIYDVPDFNNPLGTSMPLDTRRALLAAAAEEDLLVFEDNPYGQFAYDGQPAPTLKSLDTEGRVIYMGTFSKTLYPGLRLGFLVAEQQAGDSGLTLAQEFSKIKSFLSVNTSQILQAIVGGVLLENDCSLTALLQPKIAFYRDNRDAMLESLGRFTAAAGAETAAALRWNRPAGGFFLTVDAPFAFGEAEVRECAQDFGVICCPMSLFSLSGGRKRQIRLSFSYVDRPQIEEGVRRFVDYLKTKIAASQPASG